MHESMHDDRVISTYFYLCCSEYGEFTWPAKPVTHRTSGFESDDKGGEHR